MTSQSVLNFMKQQGFEDDSPSACANRFPGLGFQPRVVGILVVAGIILRWPALFLSLSGVLYWCALLPSLNPFEAFYNAVIASPSGRPLLGLAPTPRRFAQGLAATFLLAISLALWEGWLITAYSVEALLVVAISAVLFGNFCLGAYLYHLLRGQASFANATLPWARTSRGQ